MKQHAYRLYYNLLKMIHLHLNSNAIWDDHTIILCKRTHSRIANYVFFYSDMIESNCCMRQQQ